MTSSGCPGMRPSRPSSPIKPSTGCQCRAAARGSRSHRPERMRSSRLPPEGANPCLPRSGARYARRLSAP
eukprot:7404883-Prorocentrum_lima.AAC.1